MGDQIVDASLVAAPRQRNTTVEKAQIKAGSRAREIWKDKPNKAAQKDTDARWTVKIGRPRDPDVERSVPELAIAVFGYKTHVAIDRTFGFIRSWAVTSAARHDSAVLREIVTTDNTASDVWADTAYRSKINEAARPRLGQPHPPEEAAAPADARSYPARERDQIKGPLGRRARVRPAEGSHGSVYPHRRH